MELSLHLSIAFVGAMVAVVGYAMRKRFAGKYVVPTGLAIGVCGLTIGLGLGCGLMNVLGYQWTPIGTANDKQAVTASGYWDANVLVRPPLEPGNELPELQVEGWTNGAPKTTSKRGDGFVMVVDVWDDT